MVTIIFGPAKSGKTSIILNQIKNGGQSGQKSILIVPEQYSHSAERHLCKVCGNGVSLYSEVLSFSRLSNRIMSEGASFGKPLDTGGRLLVMMRALNLTLPDLKAFRNIRKKTDFAKELVNVYDEMRASRIEAEELAAVSDRIDGIFADKVRDIAVIFAAYESQIPKGMYDPAEELDKMRERVKESRIGSKEKIYIDGFTDFTMQEKAVLQEFVKKKTDLTVCLTCDLLESDNSAFQLPAETAQFLIRTARDARQDINIVNAESADKNKMEALAFFGQNVFSYGTAKYPSRCDNIEIYKAEDAAQECEIAASRIVELVRDEGYRWKDFAVSVRDWNEWQTTAENVFMDYNVPLQTAVKSDILEKPVMAVVFSALDIILNDWDYRSVFKYLKTGMTGLKSEDVDLLENYVIKWNIRGAGMWKREEAWTYNPDGYVQNITDGQIKTLSRVNEIRKAASEKLALFEDELKLCRTGEEKADCLYKFLENIDLPSSIEQRAEKLRKEGSAQQCDEYLQLWDILINGLEQYSYIIAEEETDNEEFAEMLRLVISQYEVGTIPVSLDRVSIGDMTRMKRRDIKCLIMMGMTEEAVPRISNTSYIFSDDEREELAALGIAMSDLVDSRISREMNMIYTFVTLPSDKLIMSWNTSAGRGKESFVVSAAEKIFSLEAKSPGKSVKINAPLPYFEFAVSSDTERGIKTTAAEYFKLSDKWKARFANADTAANAARGRLSPKMAEQLYSKRMNLTASRVDKYYSCRFSYFMQYGLRAKQRKPAGFDAPEAGTFMHYLLENVASEAEQLGGFGKIEREICRKLTRKYVEKYIDITLDGFKDKSSRFKYLFKRLAADAETVVLDMADELSNSDFVPVDFELTFATDGDIPPARVTDGDTEVNVVGIVDRADAWLHNDKLYLRVVDYKTGRKVFSLSDIYYGLGMQMLIYLFVLQKYGDKRYGKEVIPAGVLYAPARDIIIQMPKTATDEEIEKEKAGKLRRNGLLLSDPEVIESMEHGKTPKYLPVKFKKDGNISSDYVAGLEQLGKLARHIDTMLLNMGKELRNGAINADPYYKGPQDNACCWCEFFEACHFNDDGGEDKVRYLRKLKTPEVWEKISGEGK